MNRFPTRTALTIALLGALFVLLPRVAPAIKGPRLTQLTAVADFDPARTPLIPFKPHPPDEIAAAPVRLKAKEITTIFDDSGGVLDNFYAALWRTERKEPGAITRVSHYGDSPTTADLITGDIRAQLQARYGNAGHGFTLLAKPWAWYQHRGVSLNGSGWQIVPATHFETKDGLFGLGGVSFTAGLAAHTQIELQDAGQSNFELYYLEQPGGGTVSVTADGKPAAEISTAGDEKGPGFAAFHVAGGATELDLRPSGQVRVFGLTAEKPGPGVVYDSLGLNGASVTVLTRMFNLRHWAAELAERNPNLVVINYGTNEADFDSFVDNQYEKELHEAIRRVRTSVPSAAVLVMSPMDRGHRTGPGEIETMPAIPRIVAIQRRVAKEMSCGFFDTFDAMGGLGTMSRWYNDQPRLVSADLIHPYPAGGKIIATVFTKEIDSGLSRYKLRQVRLSSTSGAVR